ncbi:MAG: LysE family transporter [Bacteroidota bacterium]
MTIAIHLLSGFILSFIGSLPLGVINLSVAETTVNKGVKPAIWLSIGAALIEFLQAFIAVKFTNLFNDNPSLTDTIQYLAIPLFIGLSIYYFRQEPAVPGQKQTLSEGRAFFKGVFLSVINLLAIPYWIFYGTYLAGKGLLYRQDIYLLLFSAGVMLGTFTLLMLYCRLSLLVVNKIQRAAALSYQFLGYVFLAFALYQVVNLLV